MSRRHILLQGTAKRLTCAEAINVSAKERTLQR